MEKAGLIKSPADYMINVPKEVLPIPVCSSCYFCILSSKRVKKGGNEVNEMVINWQLASK